ncbi:MAG: excinuclease ABC subunit UvrA [Thermoguttaceae bacterium]|nr:excinuclease ABC subunit UvrA [Thermoguttaceae bacterium]
MVEDKRSDAIRLRKVSVNNLKAIDLDIPYGKLTALCGLSGSGKSSLAIDTLYAEGQRRYIESFSAGTRQFLEKLEKPDAELIDGIQPAVAVTSRQGSSPTRATVGTTAEIDDYLRLLYSKIGRLHCYSCGREVLKDSPDSILRGIQDLKPGTRMILAFSPTVKDFHGCRPAEFQDQWRERGFRRGIVLGESFHLDEGGIPFDKFAEAQLLALADQSPEEFPSDENVLSVSRSNDRQEIPGDEAILPGEDESAIDTEDQPTGQEESSSAPEEPGIGDLGEKLEDDEPLSKRIVTIRLDSNEYFDRCVQRWKDSHKPGGPPPLFFVIDRLVVAKTSESRIRESLESAFSAGQGRCWIFFEGETIPRQTSDDSDDFQLGDFRRIHDCAHAPGGEHACEECSSDAERIVSSEKKRVGIRYTIDGEQWTLCGFSRRLRCEDCGIEYPGLEPKLFSFNSPLGACPLCEGFGNLMTFELNKIIPDKKKSLKDSAIAPWNSPSYRYKYQELFRVAETIGLRTDVPVGELTKREMDLLLNGKRGTEFDGINGFFSRLQRQKYKMHIRVFLSRWRSYRACPLCGSARLRPEALAVTIGGKNLSELAEMSITDAADFLGNIELTDYERSIGQTILLQVKNRLCYLDQVGLGYLTLQRPLRTLSEGEQRRVSLTTVLGSSLVDMLYILDEPSIGLHPCDIQKLLRSILSLRDRGNTVVAVEHEPTILKASDRIVEIGPDAGQDGGQIVFQGTYEEICRDPKSVTGSYLSGQRGRMTRQNRRILENGFLELTGASGHNLKHIHAIFPLGVLCLVTGVSGSGKSTLIEETLYRALARHRGNSNVPAPLPYDRILGADQIDDVILVDQLPIGRSPRSNPATYLKIFDDIRNVFAETPEAKSKGYGAGYFSFNVDGGRCNTCKGEGFLTIDMQFMADMFVKCPQCGGKRYQQEILNVLYRGRNIAEVLNMTVHEAFTFFRNNSKIQQKLKNLKDVGLEYLRLGQPANTLSGGESQRLKLAAYLQTTKKGRCLFLMDEPTTGLHFADIIQLLNSFNHLLEIGHSLVIIEHNTQMMMAADYIVDLGPGAGEAGGQIVAEGTPEQVARCEQSATGRCLAELLKR